MNSLYILGNGFDLAHGIKSAYSNFKQYMHSNWKGNISSLPISNDVFLYDLDEVYGFLIGIISNSAYCKDWSDFEDALSRFKYDSYFAPMALDLGEDFDGDPLSLAYGRSTIANLLSTSIKYINIFFSEWIKTIKIDCLKLDTFCSVFRQSDLYLTFNYTKTLENLYGISIDKICHIHGTYDKKIIIGHGEEKNPYEKEYEKLYGAQDELQKIFNGLKKDVQTCYENSKFFFHQIAKQNIKDIYSFGFSFSKPDRFYIKKICQMLDTQHVTWHLTQYNESLGINEMHKKILREAGFKGVFGNMI